MYQEPVPQNEYNNDYNDNSDFDYEDYELQQELQKQRDEQEEQRKQQKAEETKKLLINHFAEVFDKDFYEPLDKGIKSGTIYSRSKREKVHRE